MGRAAWFEEDEPIYGHPRNPYARVDALRSHRQVRCELDGVVLADTAAPCCCSKPVCRQGITSTRPTSPSNISNRVTRRRCVRTRARRRGTGRCGRATRCTTTWRGRITTRCRPSRAIAGLVAFYNEKLDIIVDGIALARPKTHFS